MRSKMLHNADAFEDECLNTSADGPQLKRAARMRRQAHPCAPVSDPPSTETSRARGRRGKLQTKNNNDIENETIDNGNKLTLSMKYDETNPRPRTTTVFDDHDHRDATRLHCNTTRLGLARALLEPILLFGTCQIGISTENSSYQKPRPPIRVLITQVLVLQASPCISCIPIPQKTLVTNLSV